MSSAAERLERLRMLRDLKQRRQAATDPAEALADLGRGLAAAVDVMDGRTSDWKPGPALAWFAYASPPGRSLLGDIARALVAPEAL